MLTKTLNVITRLFFILAFLFFIIAIWEKIIGYFGYRLEWLTYTPSKLLEFAAILMMFVIALLGRQIRDEIRKTNSNK